MKTIEFPFDPQLIAAVEEALKGVPTRLPEFVQAPPQWQEATYRGKPTRINNRAEKRQVLMRRHGKRCAYCGNKFAKLSRATLDHVIPHAIVQHSQVWNLVLACEPCNQAKGSRVPAVLMPLLSTLVYRLARLNAAPVERSLVPVGGA